MRYVRLKRLRNLGKKKRYLLPYIFTFANLLCGFLAVIKTFEAEYIAASFCIIAAAMLDACDGRLARAFNSASSLGMELDSLCDAVSFCFAPVILLYSWRFFAFGWLGAGVLSFFLCAGVYRLARFNILSDVQNRSYFTGLPTTVAAFFIAIFVIAIEHSYAAYLDDSTVLLVMVGFLSIALVSMVSIPSFK